MKSAPAFQKKGQSFLISILYCKVMKKFISGCIKYSFNLFLHKIEINQNSQKLKNSVHIPPREKKNPSKIPLPQSQRVFRSSVGSGAV